MIINNLKIAYDIVNNFQKYDTLSTPPKINKLDYKVPCIDGISRFEWGKDIDEVNPNTLQYILYHLHNLDYSKVTDTLIALLYYWKIRKNNKVKMEEVYTNVISHYSCKNKSSNEYKFDIGNCVYLIEIKIGSITLFKVGKTSNIKERYNNIKSDIKQNYINVSTSVNIIDVYFNSNNENIEKTILNNIKPKRKHKFFFKGHTESFESDEVINVFKKVVKDFN